MTPDERIISRQRERIEELEEELRQAKAVMSPQIVFPNEWRLSPAQDRLLAAFFVAPHGFLSYERAAAVVISWAHESDDPRNIVATQTCKLRARLKSHGIEIATCWGRGFELPSASKAIIQSRS